MVESPQWLSNSKDKTALWALGLYLLMSCSVTALNKILLNTPFPYFLTASHGNVTLIACKIIRRDKPRTRLPWQAHLKLLCFSFLYTVNIGISNASLDLVTLPVHQAIRATSPVLTVLLARLLPTHNSERYDFTIYLRLFPVVVGVVLATYGGRYNASLWGLALTIIGAVLAVTKTIVTKLLLRSAELNLRPIELLSILSPYAGAQALVWAILNGELGIVFQIAPGAVWFAILFLVNTAMAAVLNIVSFDANRRNGPLAMAITANLKQVFLLAVPWGGKFPDAAVVLGTLSTVIESMWCAYVRSPDQEEQQSTVIHVLQQHRRNDT